MNACDDISRLSVEPGVARYLLHNRRFYPPMPDFPYTDAGQAAYVHSQLIWASNNRNIIGWTWFYPEWFPGISTDATNLQVSGMFSDRTTLRPSVIELNVVFQKKRFQNTSE